MTRSDLRRRERTLGESRVAVMMMAELGEEGLTRSQGEETVEERRVEEGAVGGRESRSFFRRDGREPQCRCWEE